MEAAGGPCKGSVPAVGTEEGSGWARQEEKEQDKQALLEPSLGRTVLALR